jgi:predicted RNA-binding Zn-ribbon protein involved in translation (DUF1610 family)
MNETIGVFWVVLIVAVVSVLAVGWLVLPYLLLRRMDSLSRQLGALAAQIEACSGKLDTAHAQADQANGQLDSIVDAVYVSVKCAACGEQIRFPAHCRGHTHACPQCRAGISLN